MNKEPYRRRSTNINDLRSGDPALLAKQEIRAQSYGPVSPKNRMDTREIQKQIYGGDPDFKVQERVKNRRRAITPERGG